MHNQNSKCTPAHIRALLPQVQTIQPISPELIKAAVEIQQELIAVSSKYQEINRELLKQLLKNYNTVQSGLGEPGMKRQRLEDFS